MPTGCPLPDLTGSTTLHKRLKSSGAVFRVFDDQSKTDYSPHDGISPLGSGSIQTPQDLSTTIENHMIWWCSKPSPWISTTRRWWWAIWEMKRRRRADRYHTNIRITVIDLDICRNMNPDIPFAAELAHDGPCVHALSGLAGADADYSNFANMADEILIYDKIPADAIISVVPYENIIPLLPPEFQDPQPENSTPFRVFHAQCAHRLADEKKWDPMKRGEMCADMALLLLDGAYNDLTSRITVSTLKVTLIKQTSSELEDAISKRRWGVDEDGLESYFNEGLYMDSDEEGSDTCLWHDNDDDYARGFVSKLGGKRFLTGRLHVTPSLLTALNNTSEQVLDMRAPWLEETWDKTMKQALRQAMDYHAVCCLNISVIWASRKHLLQLVNTIRSRVTQQTPELKENVQTVIPTDRKEEGLIRDLIQTLLKFFTDFKMAIIASAREALEHFRYLALELARMILLGLVQGVLEQHWWAMKECMVDTVRSKLDWSEKQVEVLEDARPPHPFGQCYPNFRAEG